MKTVFLLTLTLFSSTCAAELQHWVSISANQLDLDNELDIDQTISDQFSGVSLAAGSLYPLSSAWSAGVALEYNFNQDSDLTFGSDNILTFYFADIQYRLNNEWQIKGRMGLSSYDASDTVNDTATGWNFGSVVGYKLNNNMMLQLSADYYHELAVDNDRRGDNARPDFFISGLKVGAGFSYLF